jgi:hypothetical protein
MNPNIEPEPTFTDGHGNIHPESERDDYSECENCAELYDDTGSYEVELESNGRHVSMVLCDGCRDDYYCCESCDSFTRNPRESDGGSYYCNACADNNPDWFDEDDGGGELRNGNIQLGKQYFASGRKRGTWITSPRMFGVEFEMVPVTTIKDRQFRFFDHMETWGVDTDGSLSGGGIEVTTPPMRLDKGEKALLEFSKKTQEAGWGVDRTCGTHVHLDAPEFGDNPKLLRRAVLSYLLLDDAILRMLPEPRRRNSYCSPLNRANAVLGKAHIEKGAGFTLGDFIGSRSLATLRRKIYKAKSEQEIQRELGSHYSTSRYYGINFHSLWNRGLGTIEIRYHQGTVDAKELLPWIAFHQHVLDNARKITDEQALLLKGIHNPESRLVAYALYTKMDKKVLDAMVARIKKYKTTK